MQFPQRHWNLYKYQIHPYIDPNVMKGHSKTLGSCPVKEVSYHIAGFGEYLVLQEYKEPKLICIWESVTGLEF